MGPMDVGETGYNTDTILIDVIIAASGSMSGLMLIRPGLQVSGKVVEQTCASGRFLKKKSTTNPIQCWQHIAKPTVYYNRRRAWHVHPFRNPDCK